MVCVRAISSSSSLASSLHRLARTSAAPPPRRRHCCHVLPSPPLPSLSPWNLPHAPPRHHRRCRDPLVVILCCLCSVPSLLSRSGAAVEVATHAPSSLASSLLPRSLVIAVIVSVIVVPWSLSPRHAMPATVGVRGCSSCRMDVHREPVIVNETRISRLRPLTFAILTYTLWYLDPDKTYSADDEVVNIVEQVACIFVGQTGPDARNLVGRESP